MKRLTTALLLSLTLTATTTQGAIIFTAATATTPGSLTITQDINFTIAANITSFARVVFDNWVTDDHSLDAYSGSPTGPLTYILNGTPGSVNTNTNSFLVDNLTFPLGDMTPNDGYISFDPVYVVAGNTVTLKAQTWTLPAGSTPASFNLQRNGQTYTGDVYLGTSSFFRASNITSAAGSVPEPTTALTGLLSLGLLAARRRR